MVTGPGFSSPNQPDQERTTACRDSSGPKSRSDAHCATIVGDWEEPSGESRLGLVPNIPSKGSWEAIIGNVIMPITGGCLCGAVRYEADQSPYHVGYCHCNMCKKGVGNLFGAFACFRLEQFRYVSKEPAWYASSASVKRGFCSHCGSPIAYQPNQSDSVFVWIGSLDNPEKFEPHDHHNTENKIPWVDIQAHLPDWTGEGISRRYGTYEED